MIIKYLKLPFQFDAERLREELTVLEKIAWQSHYQTLHYEGEWTALPLRSVEGRADDVFVSPEATAVYKDTAYLAESPYLQSVLAHFKCPLQGVRLLKLSAGAVIKEHRDADLSYEKGEIRLHIPVITHADVEFYLDKERMQVKEGECWYMNFNLPHSIINNSPVNRVHLVIDGLVNDWVKAVFEQDSEYKKQIPEPDHSPDVKKKMIEQLRQMNTETATRLADELEAQLNIATEIP